ncbi:hypothetical protein Tco_1055138 [Tanacetum coccineum]|uniref:Uncharacterized protein n=1 Tax=Tanacetum coccineum TaxID=301880 RepID=A0ABQ5GYU7_9ASTR
MDVDDYEVPHVLIVCVEVEGLYFDPSGYAWHYTYAYIQDGVTFIAKRLSALTLTLWLSGTALYMMLITEIALSSALGLDLCLETSESREVAEEEEARWLWLSFESWIERKLKKESLLVRAAMVFCAQVEASNQKFC